MDMKKGITKTLLLIITGVFMFNFLTRSSGDMEISAEKFKERFEGKPGVVIDVRTKEEHEAGHLKLTDALYNWLDGELHDAVDQLDRDETYYLYCRTGNRSGQAAQMMKSKGFENVYNIGGYQDLVDSGLETKR